MDSPCEHDDPQLEGPPCSCCRSRTDRTPRGSANHMESQARLCLRDALPRPRGVRYEPEPARGAFRSREAPAMLSQLMLVQFPHPGSEHKPPGPAMDWKSTRPRPEVPEGY